MDATCHVFIILIHIRFALGILVELSFRCQNHADFFNTIRKSYQGYFRVSLSISAILYSIYEERVKH